MASPPPDQRSRNIGFLLEGGGQPAVSYDFYIRPEELTYNEPSRLQVVQTLGGAWADSFGRGLGTISMSGNTGWIGTPQLSGEDLYKNLRLTVFKSWHDRRAAAIALGQDPTKVNLYFADSLDSISVLAAPQSFTLRRSRLQPLLFNFEIQLLSLGDANLPADAADSITLGMTNPLRWQDAIAGINVSNTILGRLVSTVSGIFSTIGNAVRTFMNMATSIFSAITSLAQEAQGVFDQTIGTAFALAQSIAVAGRNAFNALATLPGMVFSDVASVMQVASAFTDIYCSMINGFNSLTQFLSFDGLLGASNCSSTGGGEGNSYFTMNDLNPFDSINSAVTPPFGTSSFGQSSLGFLSQDPQTLSESVASSPGVLSVGNAMSTASSGVFAPAGSPLAKELDSNTGAFSADGYNFGADYSSP